MTSDCGCAPKVESTSCDCGSNCSCTAEKKCSTSCTCVPKDTTDCGCPKAKGACSCGDNCTCGKDCSCEDCAHDK